MPANCSFTNCGATFAIDLSLVHSTFIPCIHTYIHTYSIFTYMHVCLLPFMEQRLALLSRCAIQFLPTFDCLYKTLSSFCLHSLPLLYLQKGFFTQFQFLWHCMVLIYVYLCLSWQCYSVTWRWQRGVWATSYVRQDKTPGALVCMRLSLGTCPVNSLRSLPQICMRPFCLSL